MKMLFWIGVAFVVLGIASLFVAIPQTQNEGVKVGDLNIGVQTRQKEKVSPIVTAVLIVAGAGMMIGGGRAMR